MAVQGEDTGIRCSSPCVLRSAHPGDRPLEQPQRLGLLLLRLSLGGPGLRRPLLTPVPAPGRGSGPLVGRVWRVPATPFGLALIIDSEPLLRQAEPDSVIETIWPPLPRKSQYRR